MTRPAEETQSAPKRPARVIDNVAYLALVTKLGAAAAAALEDPPVCRPYRLAA